MAKHGCEQFALATFWRYAFRAIQISICLESNTTDIVYIDLVVEVEAEVLFRKKVVAFRHDPMAKVKTPSQLNKQLVLSYY